MPSVNDGNRVGVSLSLPITSDLLGFSALDYTQVKGVASFGEVGEAYEVIQNNAIQATSPIPIRSAIKSNSIPFTAYRIRGDAGQALLKESLIKKISLSFRIAINDGSFVYFSAFVSSRYRGIGNPSSVSNIQYTFEIQSRIIEDD